MNSITFHILLAEDNPADVFLVRMALKEAGIRFELQVFEDGAQLIECLEQLENQRAACPNLLLLDLNMPRASGEEVLSRLKALPACVAIPVIVLTSSSHPRDREYALEYGVAHYFRKPDDYDAFMRLSEVIKSVLERSWRVAVNI